MQKINKKALRMFLILFGGLIIFVYTQASVISMLIAYSMALLGIGILLIPMLVIVIGFYLYTWSQRVIPTFKSYIHIIIAIVAIGILYVSFKVSFDALEKDNHSIITNESKQEVLVMLQKDYLQALTFLDPKLEVKTGGLCWGFDSDSCSPGEFVDDYYYLTIFFTKKEQDSMEVDYRPKLMEEINNTAWNTGIFTPIASKVFEDSEGADFASEQLDVRYDRKKKQWYVTPEDEKKLSIILSVTKRTVRN